MATNQATRETRESKGNTAEKRERKPAPPMQDRMRNQLTNAALRGKISGDELEGLSQHIDKLKALLA